MSLFQFKHTNTVKQLWLPPAWGGLNQCFLGFGLLSSEGLGGDLLSRDPFSCGCVENQIPHLLEKRFFSDGGVVAQCVGCCPELWAEAVPEVVHVVAIAGEELFAVVVPRVMALILSPT